ncbi:MAG TPA: leucyl/phenylalanyl-tRNA--protein transferase [Acidimicrobiales bacterium]|nr:leucyl/phenylalanyl-tRNA--protein transferase [Acidimicrobiales bacterium]
MWRELPPTAWQFPDPRDAEGDVVAVGGDLEPGTVLAAYARGIFPMPLDGRLAWWSPEPRAILPLDGLRVSRSLRASCRRFEIRVDTAFDEVIEACADPARPHGWITAEIAAAYRRLHRLGWAHSVEAWAKEDGTLAGGLYGVSLGGLFAGESMFHLRRDASKAALVALVDLLAGDGVAGRLLDVQWATEHLRSLGAVELGREEYLRRLSNVLHLPPPPAFGAILGNRP